MERGSFGEHLKREREMRGVSLEEISAATRIGTRFLSALESEQWERLPGGVFNRGFVRAVARFLGLDEESMIAEYALSTNDRPVVAIRAMTPAASSGSNWVRTILLVVLCGAIIGGGWYGWRRYAAHRAGLHKSPPAGPAAPVEGSGTSAPEPPTPAPVAATSPVPPSPASATPGEQSTGAEPATLTLAIEAGKSTTLKVLADGNVVFDGKINAGESRRLQAQESFEVTASDASAVLLELNGQTVAPLGPPGRPGSVTLARKDLKKPSGGPD